MAKNKIGDLRDHLFETLEALKDPDKPMDTARAQAVASVAKQIIESANVEVAFMRETGQAAGTGFIPDNSADVVASAPAPTTKAKHPKVAKAAPARPIGASSDSQIEAVLTALAHGPRLMKELQVRTKLSRYLLSKALDTLQAQKRVTVNGHTSERRVELT